jgi:hypothetical protein
MALIYVSEGLETETAIAASSAEGLAKLKAATPDEGRWVDDKFDLPAGRRLIQSFTWREWDSAGEEKLPDRYVVVPVIG